MGGRSGAIGRSVVLQVAVRAVGMIASFLTITISTRYLGLDGYGLLTTATVFVGLFASFTELGIGPVIIRRVMNGRGTLARLVGVNLGFSLVFGPVVAGVTALLGLIVYDDPTLQLAVAIMAAGLLMTSLSTCWDPVYEVHLRFGAVAMADGTSRVLTLAATAAVAATDSGLLAMAAVQVIPMAARLLVNLCTAPRIERGAVPSMNRREIVSLVRESLPFTLLLVVAVLYYRVDGLLLSIFATPADVGIYGVAVALIGTVSFVSTVFCKAVYPTMAKAFATDRDAFVRTVHRSYQVMLALSVPIAVLGWITAARVLAIVGPPEFVERGELALRLFLISGAISFLNALLTQPLIAAGEQRFLTWAVPLGLTVNIIANLIAVPHLGVVGTGIALIISEAQGVALAMWRLGRLGCAPFRPIYLIKLLPGLALAIGAVWLLWDLPFVFPAVTAAVVYGLASMVTGAIPIEAVKDMLKRRGAREAAVTN